MPNQLVNTWATHWAKLSTKEREECHCNIPFSRSQGIGTHITRIDVDIFTNGTVGS